MASLSIPMFALHLTKLFLESMVLSADFFRKSKSQVKVMPLTFLNFPKKKKSKSLFLFIYLISYSYILFIACS